MTKLQNPEKWVLGFITLFYLGFIFPHCYFRGDDWLLLSNSVVHLPKDWSFLFRSTLVVWFQEETWFFRPFVKLSVYLLFKVFAFNYYAWISFYLSLFLISLFLARKSIFLITHDNQRSSLFTCLLASFLPLHFGNIAWIGEGAMNCPQLLLLMLTVLFWIKYVLSNFTRGVFLAGSLSAFVLSLGFKENSVFLPLFMLPLCVSLNVSMKKYLKIWPFFLASLIFTIIRLHFMPVNRGYIPSLSPDILIRRVWKPLLYLSSLGVPLLFWMGWLFFSHTSLKTILKTLLHWSVFLPFIVIVMLPHLGHEFFSPGWLLLPGFFLVLSFAIYTPILKINHNLSQVCVSLLLFFVSFAPILYKIKDWSWLDWHKTQRQLHQIIKESKDDVPYIHMFYCENAQAPKASSARVIGGEPHVIQMWRMHHPQNLKAYISPCDYKIDVAGFGKVGWLILKYDFPNIIPLAYAKKDTLLP